MFIVVRNPLYRVIGLAVSLIIVAIIYFAVIKPSTDTANSAVTTGEKQLQQAVRAANQQSGGAVPANVQNLTACMVAAGTDTGKIQACQAKFH